MLTLKRIYCSTVFLSALLFSIFTQAQTDKKKHSIVGIMPFTSAEPEYKKQASQLQTLVTSTFSGNSHVVLLDRSKVAQIEQELNKQKNANYVKGKTVPQNKAFGAKMLITGTLTDVTVEKTKMGGSKIPTRGPKGGDAATTKAMVSFELQAIDVATGETINNKTFDIAATDMSNMDFGGVYSKETSDGETAVIKANKEKIKLQVTEWVNELFPPEVKMFKIEEYDKKKLPTIVLVKGGEDAKLTAGMYIDIKESEEIDAGDGDILTREKVIGALRVISVQGQVFVCKVIDGEDIVEGIMNKENVRLLVNYKRRGLPMGPGKKNK